MDGFFVTNAAKCQACPALCSSCATSTGSCSACMSIKYNLYLDTTLNVNFCTDKLCSPACLNCDIQAGMNTVRPVRRPNCLKCAQGYFMTNDNDCQLCPLNCGRCDDLTGTCNYCKPGFSLYTTLLSTQCISDSTVGVCTVPHCGTCDANSNSTCVICDPGFSLDVNL
jgi:hypothetical protein